MQFSVNTLKETVSHLVYLLIVFLFIRNLFSCKMKSLVTFETSKIVESLQ